VSLDASPSGSAILRAISPVHALAVSVAGPRAGVTGLDAGCMRACTTFQGWNPPGSCEYLCGVQQARVPQVPPRVQSTNGLPGYTPVDLYACEKQCTETRTPQDEQLCRIGCAVATGAPKGMWSASGGCMQLCLQGCVGKPYGPCASGCAVSCSGGSEESFVTRASPVLYY
jgi:hypothetical protein